MVDEDGEIDNGHSDQEDAAANARGLLQVEQGNHQQHSADQAERQHDGPFGYALLVALGRIEAENVNQTREHAGAQQDARQVGLQPHVQIIVRDDEVRADDERHRENDRIHHEVEGDVQPVLLEDAVRIHVQLDFTSAG